MHQSSIGPRNLFKSKKHRRDDYQRPKEKGVVGVYWDGRGLPRIKNKEKRKVF